MWKFWEIEWAHFKTLLESGKLDDHIEELYSHFWELPPSHQYELVKYSKDKEVFPSVQTFRKVFRVSEETAVKFFKEKHITFRFPVVLSNGEGELIRAVAVKNLKEVITNLKNIKRHLNPIKEFLKTGFAVFFDRNLLGQAFNCPRF
jgi:hypothetical protein